MAGLGTIQDPAGAVLIPDLVAAIKNHNATMNLWWHRKEYKVERKLFVWRNPKCARCGRPTQTPGHSHEDYSSYERYLDAVKTDKCEPLCNICNLNERYGRKPCPVCVSEKASKIRYIHKDAEVCFDHLPEEEQHRIWTKQRLAKKGKNLFPCNWRESNQKCKNPFRYSGVCDRSPVTADGCDYFLSRKVLA